MRDRVLVRIGEGLPHAADGAAGPASEPFVGPRGRNLADDRLAAQIGINSPGQRDQPLTSLSLSREISLRRKSLPGRSSQCVEIITARWPAGALSRSPAAETETNMLLPSPSGRS